MRHFADLEAECAKLLAGTASESAPLALPAEMSALGLPVPPGFTLTTEACNVYTGGDKRYPEGLDSWSQCARSRAPPCPA